MPSDSAETIRLYLMRHAHAGWATPNTSDFERPLDEQGRFEARDVAEQALMAGMRPDVLVSSPARRCRETTAAFLDVFRDLRSQEDEQLYSGGSDAYLGHIVAHRDVGSLMIIGHNPMIEALAHHLARPSAIIAPIAMGYPTAGLLALSFPKPLPHKMLHAGEALHFFTPALT
ncbi:SixA phosphatase family protein [Rhizobium sp. LjRoot254]|uniref:SixA phosphatase family protein n=1 Tax=Rhizobium sp. LjRoot254 TaxID=3342297 RepID=UPI003ECEDF26